MSEREERLNGILLRVAKSLDIPPGKYKQAVERYNAVGRWLDQKGTSHVCPQGSFRLGTVVRPGRGGKEADYDIDLVYLSELGKSATTPRALKTMVGDRLRKNQDYERMLDEEGRRCWTLQYAEEDGVGFHLDVLPSVAEEQVLRERRESLGVRDAYVSHAIAATDKDYRTGDYTWSPSNPEGYALWFDDINKQSFCKIVSQQKQMIFEGHMTIYSSVLDVPDALIRTPLQRTIQLLKRHRDVRFLGHQWEKQCPISIILTTLAARAYRGEEDIHTMLDNVIGRIEKFAQTGLIEYQDGKWRIPNPVDPAENFAERWNDQHSHRAEAFFLWLRWLREDLVEMLDCSRLEETQSVIERGFGKHAAEALGKDKTIAGTSNLTEEELRAAYTRGDLAPDRKAHAVVIASKTGRNPVPSKPWYDRPV